MTIGFVGLGRMGMPMARALARAGFTLTVYNRTRERAVALGEDPGVMVAATPGEVMRGAETVVTMLADGPAVDAVMHGDDGLLANARPGTLLIEMSTIGPDHARTLAEEAQRGGATLLDAPVSGSVALAEAGTLTTLVGGDRDVFVAARSVLSAMTRTQLWLGPSGAGAAMKLCLNGLIAATNHAVAEALVVAERSGIDRTAAYDAIAASAVGSPFVEYKRDAFVTPSDEPVAFTLSLMQKDLALYLELAARLGVSLQVTRSIHDAIGRARVSQGDDADLAAVAGALRAPASAEVSR